MLNLRLSGNTLVIEERGGDETCVHFDTRGQPVAVAITRTAGLAEPATKSWKLEGKRSPFKNSKPQGRTDFQSTLKSALRVSLGR